MRKAAVVIALALAAAVYWLRLDGIAGLTVDDAWYALLGRSIAQGTGFQLANAPTPGLLPPNPPAFPFLLAGLFRLSPSFPANVPLLKSLSIAAMFGAGILTFVHARRRAGWSDELALLAAAAVVLAPPFVWLATSTLMSECMFTWVLLGAVVAADRRQAAGATILAVALAAFATLVRLQGIAVVAGILLFFCWRREWRRAALAVTAAAIALGPWFAYRGAHEPAEAQRIEHGGAHAFTYESEFWMRWAGDRSTGVIGVRDLPARVVNNAVDVFGRDVAGLVAPELFRGGGESGEEVVSLGDGFVHGSMGNGRATMVISAILSVLCLLGWIGEWRRGPSSAEFVAVSMLAVVLVWPQWSYRFVLPLLPFLLIYLAAGIRRLAGARWERIARPMLLAIVVFALLDHAQYVAAARAGSADWPADARDVDSVFAWMQDHARDEAVVATTNPALVYLRTGHRTVASDDYAGNWDGWRARGVRYIVCLRQADLPRADRFTYEQVFRSARGYWVVRIL